MSVVFSGCVCLFVCCFGPMAASYNQLILCHLFSLPDWSIPLFHSLPDWSILLFHRAPDWSVPLFHSLPDWFILPFHRVPDRSVPLFLGVPNCCTQYTRLFNSTVSWCIRYWYCLFYSSVSVYFISSVLLFRSLPVCSVPLFHLCFISSALLFHSLRVRCMTLCHCVPSLPYYCFKLFLYATVTSRLLLFHTTVSYCYCMSLLHHAPLSIREFCTILFLYPSLPYYCFTLSSSMLLFHIVPVCHCYIPLPSPCSTTVSYCSCMPLLHHAPLSSK